MKDKKSKKNEDEEILEKKKTIGIKFIIFIYIKKSLLKYYSNKNKRIIT